LDGICIAECPAQGFYPNDDDSTCEQCLPQCVECTDTLVCSVCATGFYFNAVDTTCVDLCPVGTYHEEGTDPLLGGTCVDCSIECKACVDGETCANCNDGNVLRDDNACVEPLDDVQCNEAVENCTHCDLYGACEACLIGFVLEEGACVQITLEGGL